MSANEMQVGGRHYKSTYQYWDLVLTVGMGYLEGNAGKYISRWRKKGGTEDLKKALHYVEKLLECSGAAYRLRCKPRGPAWIMSEVERFAKINELGGMETKVLLYLSLWEHRSSLEYARDYIVKIMASQDVGDEAIHAMSFDHDQDTARAGSWDYEKEFNR